MNKLPRLYRDTSLGGWIINNKWHKIIFKNASSRETNSDNYILKLAGFKDHGRGFIKEALENGAIKVQVNWDNLNFRDLLIWIDPKAVSERQFDYLIEVLMNMKLKKPLRMRLKVLKNGKILTHRYVYRSIPHLFLFLYTQGVS
jgi:hypothetical protein